MVVSIQTGPQRTVDAVDLLLECHGRIRSFLALAETIGKAPPATDAETADACSRVSRYFGVALPLHARDEDESVLPRLRGREPALDEALDQMADEHGTHGVALAALLGVLDEVRAQPAEPSHRQRLLAATMLLESLFRTHLYREEKVIFPAIRSQLDEAARDEVLREIRARRVGA